MIYNCETCHKTLKSKESLSSHQKNVHGNKRYSCEICGEEFKENRYLSITQCQKAFLSVYKSVN